MGRLQQKHMNFTLPFARVTFYILTSKTVQPETYQNVTSVCISLRISL